MASLQDSSLEEEQFTAAIQAQGLRHCAAVTALPLSHGAARKWFYKDPQGEIQGFCGEPGLQRGRRTTQAHSCSGLLWRTFLIESLFLRARPLHNTGDGRVVPGRLFLHVPAGEAGL